MTPADLTVIGVYLALTLVVGLRVARRAARSDDDYFLGARDLPAWAVMLSIVATETSALTVISVPGLAARGDLTFLQLAFGYLVGRIAVAVWLLPGYFEGRQQTAYQRLEARFGAGTRRLLSLTFLLTRLLADGVRIFAGAIPLALLTGWDVATAIVVMGGVTLLYTVAGGLRAVVWADALQLVVYVAGGVAVLVVALQLAADAQGSLSRAVAAAAAAGKLQLVDLELSLTRPYVLLGGLLGGALMSAASHGTDQIIVQRLLATRSLADARLALVGSGLLVIAQFALFLLVGTALWAAGHAPAGLAGDAIFPRFVIEELPRHLPGLAGLVVAAILAAAMSTISSSISALASSMTHDLVAPRLSPSRRADPARWAADLLRIGQAVSLGWGLALVAAALGFRALDGGRDTPVVVLALSIASVTYGALLAAYVLAGERWRHARRAVGGRDVITGAAVAMVAMLVVVFAARLAALPGLGVLAPLGRLAFPWYVPLGCAVAMAVALLSARLRHARVSGPRSPPA
jgi:SSS family transporter